jgi:hypothetical protein
MYDNLQMFLIKIIRLTIFFILFKKSIAWYLPTYLFFSIIARTVKNNIRNISFRKNIHRIRAAKAKERIKSRPLFVMSLRRGHSQDYDKNIDFGYLCRIFFNRITRKMGCLDFLIIFISFSMLIIGR